MPISKQDMPDFQAGDVVTTIFEPADDTRKKRPAIILCKVPPYDDFLCCAVTSKLQHEVTHLDEVIHQGDEEREADEDFAASGLHVTSLIRVAFLGYYRAEHFHGHLGTISQERLHRLRGKLVALLSET